MPGTGPGMTSGGRPSAVCKRWFDDNAIFAANRATGNVALSVAAAGGVTRRRRVHEDGSLRVRFPNSEHAALEAVLVNTAGGIAGGDRFAVALEVGPGADLIAGTAAAEKIYRSESAAAEVALTLNVGEGARLAWLPQETILFDRARLVRRIDIDLADGASLVLAEALVFGRAAMGEAVEQGTLIDRWRLRRGGKLVFAETTRLDGAIGRDSGAACRRKRRRRHRHRSDRAGQRGDARRRPRARLHRRGWHVRLERHRRGAALRQGRRGAAPRSHCGARCARSTGTATLDQLSSPHEFDAA